MKILKYILTAAAVFVLAVSCNEGIDPISRVEPGEDVEAPVVTINYPFEGARIQVREDVTPINIDVEATDDIEIQSVVINLDDVKIAEFTDFKDYRRALETYTYENLTNGAHTLNVVSTDLTGKSTSEIVNFEKVPPYEPVYPGEIFYMPFDGDYLELLSLNSATPAGNPTLVNGVSGKAVSFNAANKSYVTYPGDVLSSLQSFSVSFWINPDFVDSNSDGGIDGILGMVNFSNVSGFWGNFDLFAENGSKPSGSIIKGHIFNSDGNTDTWVDNISNVQNFFGQWSYHVLTYDDDAKEVSYYINGVLVSTKSAGWSNSIKLENGGPMVFGTVQFQTTPSLTTGSGSQTWASYLTGEMDEIRIFDRALSAEDVQQIYDDVM